MREELPNAELLGLPVHGITERECIATVLSCLRIGRGGWVVTPNLDILRQCARDEGARSLVMRADLIVPDGMPLIWASRLRRTPLPERVAGSSLISTLSAAAAEEGRSIFLLGGAPGSAEAASAALLARNPQLRVAGTHCPPFGFESNPAEIENIERVLGESLPDIVFVGLGFPKQENLIARLRPLLPRAWWLGVGVSFSFLAGSVRRAPNWMRRSGLEWAHRLAQEPRRLGKRYLVDGIPFACHLLLRSAWDGMTRARRMNSPRGGFMSKRIKAGS